MAVSDLVGFERAAYDFALERLSGEPRAEERAYLIAKRVADVEVIDEAEMATQIYIAGAVLDEDLEKSVRSFSQETLTIQRSRRTPPAQGPHPFRAATWSTRKGASRCLTCGKGQPEGESCGGLAAAFTKVLTDEHGFDVRLMEPQAYALVKSTVDASAATADQRYTFTVVYKASASGFKDPILDAHNEFAGAEDLRAAKKGYIESGDRNIYLQHGLVDGLGMKKIGEWEDLAQIPWEVTTDFIMPGGRVEKRTIPANSVWMGTHWTEEAWPAVKSGQISGLSFGGRAARKTED